MSIKYLRLFLLLTLFCGCIGDDYIDDFVDPSFSIIQSADELAVGEDFQFESRFLNNIGLEEKIPVEWSSSDNSIISIDQNGLAQGITEGQASIIANTSYEGIVYEAVKNVKVGTETVVTSEIKNGSIVSTSSYLLEGDFTFFAEGDDVALEFGADYRASTALPGLYVYLSNNRNTINNAYEIGEVKIFEGAHQYKIRNTGLNDYKYVLYYCKPFNVKVGDGEIK